MDIEEYNKYKEHWFQQHQAHTNWEAGNYCLQKAYKYHKGCWRETLSLAEDFYEAYRK